MRRITLIVRDSVDPHLPIEAEVITPETLCKTVRVNVYVGNQKMQLSDVFDIRVDGEAAGPGATEIILIGDASRVKRVGEYMTDGRIIVDGDIGMHCGDFMTGGTIEIMGNAGDWLGREMLGGKIICHGNAGNYCGSGYRGGRKGVRGGEILVEGSVGDYCGECLFGGVVRVLGNAGLHAGTNMKGGKLIIEGNAVLPCGDMFGGECTIFGHVDDFMPTFAETGKIVENGRELTVFTGDLAHRNGKGTLRVGSYTRI
ncbi:formylmethanofuran dehydrogenase subunit C [Methanocorpusculum sp. MG]|uniref:formylmethanofuran dehydrogenase n=1 Tax=Methanocorpusculum petauri TaxID=3002863 RepID=A0ABT4IGK5_9EURY|nr:formylmethanofuran dehydrogenase subunit C [Methanocorpusculum petauri]MCZ0860382.1 formylmethanofuran dehydrogenase subunit C [Methanocorpusculum petauri]MCZ9312863.1 formylmethanofuran dehydrogenase subunit C [Methanocorpusculum sp.]